MLITKNFNGTLKTLYHLQNMDICDGGEPFDIFFWCEHEPKEEDIKNAIKMYTGIISSYKIKKILTTSEIFKVYAED